MRTWKTKEGKYVSEKPENYFVALDYDGNEVYIGDTMFHRNSKRTFIVYEKTWPCEIKIAKLKIQR